MDAFTTTSKTLPAVEDTINISQVEDEGGIIGSMYTAAGASNKALDVDGDKHLQHVVEVFEA